MNGTDTLMKHVKGVKHWRKIGKFFVNGQLRETFNPVADPFVPKKPAKEASICTVSAVQGSHEYEDYFYEHGINKLE